MGRTARTLIAILAALLVLGTVAILLAPLLIERAIRTELSRRGVDFAEFAISMPGFGGVTARNIRIGADSDFAADSLSVDYRIRGVIQGQIEQIRLVRPRLRLEVSRQGEVSFGSLDALLRRSGGDTEAHGEPAASPGLFLPAPLEIIDGSISAETPAGTLTAQIDGAVTLAAGAGPLTIALTGPWLIARLEVKVNSSEGASTLSGQVIDARIDHPLLKASLAGSFAIAIGTGSPTADAEIAVSNVTSPLLKVGSGPPAGDLSIRFRPDELALDLRLRAPGGHLQTQLRGDPAQLMRATISGDGLTVPETLSEARLDAAFELVPTERRAILEKPAQIEGRISQELRDAMPGPMHEAFAETPLLLTVAAGSTFIENPAGLSFSGGISLAQEKSFGLTLDGTLTQEAAGVVCEAEGRLSVANLTLGGASLQKASLIAPLKLAAHKDRVNLDFAGPGTLSVGALAIGRSGIAQITVPLLPIDAPLFALAPEGMTFAVQAGSGKTTGKLGQNREPFTFSWKQAFFRGSWGEQLTANISGGQLTLSRLGWQAEGVTAHFEADDSSTQPPVINLTIGNLAQSRKDRVLAPLVVEGALYPTDTMLRFDLLGRTLGGEAQFTMKGGHDIRRDRGSAELSLGPLRFVRRGLQPATLFPFFGDSFEDATGLLAINGSIGWSGKGLTSDLDIAVEQMNFLGPLGPVLGLDARVNLNGILPLSTPPGQHIAIRAVQSVVPMSDVLAQFEVREGRTLSIERAHLMLADGRVAVAPVTLDAQAARNRLVLELAEVRLPLLFELIGLDGLTGTGRLVGEIPIVLEQNDLAIEDGRLESQEAGRIRYDPAKTPSALQGGGESVGLALAALRDFHYDRLALKLNREIGGETLVELHIAGRNPDFYEGYPVEFNLNLSGKLDRILIEALTSYRLPRTIEDSLQVPPGESRSSAP
ncbi:MAG TPA: YdbH domain-containing protein [Alphaproteobacteria bacterium]|nr:YdbH domain-containing protein [Alphaproteobacteria bacterium]